MRLLRIAPLTHLTLYYNMIFYISYYNKYKSYLRMSLKMAYYDENIMTTISVLLL